MIQRFRFDRKGNVVPDMRRMSVYYRDPDGTKYKRGMPLFEQKAPGSPGRQRFKAARALRRLTTNPKGN